MARKSSIKKLSEEALEFLHKQIAKGRTIDQMVADVEKAYGETIKRSATGRYTKNYKKAATKMREAKELAKAWGSELGEISDNKQTRLNIEMLHTFIFKIMAEYSEDDSEKILGADGMMKLARSVKDLASASKIDADHKAQLRKEVLADAAEEAGVAMTEKGISKDTVSFVKKQILGMD